MSTPAATGMQAATRRAFGEAACHLRTDAGGPRCGQVAANGRGWARTHYTADPARVTCMKCRRAIEASNPTT